MDEAEALMFSIGLFLGIYIGCYYFEPNPDPNGHDGLEWVGQMSLAVYMILLHALLLDFLLQCLES
jgi:hypothetical protein